MITQVDLNLLSRVSRLSGFDISSKDLILLNWDKGIDTHKPTALPKGYFAIYIFVHRKLCLKVGKVSGETNNDRYYQHHYIAKAANSTLAKSLVNHPKYSKLFVQNKVRNWIIENTSRQNILIPVKCGRNFVNFAEAFFILRCDPLFEGRRKKVTI